jgi:hypothetical protein
MPSDATTTRRTTPATLTCDEVTELLPGVVDGSRPAADAVARHVDHCLRCQAELVQYRRLLRTLRQLRTDVLEPAPGLLTDILANIEAAGERRAIRSLVRGRRAAYVGGIAAAATAASAAGAIVLVSRARRRNMRLAG